MGIEDFSKKYELNEIVLGDQFLCYSITSGDLVSGIEQRTINFYPKH